MIEYICDVWYDSHIITQDIIYKSFRETGIANRLGKSEDYLFTSWARMKDDNPIIENDLEKTFYLMDKEGIENEVLDDEDN